MDSNADVLSDVCAALRDGDSRFCQGDPSVALSVRAGREDRPPVLGRSVDGPVHA